MAGSTLYNAFGYQVVIAEFNAGDIDTDSDNFVKNNMYTISSRLRFDVSPSEYVDGMNVHVWVALAGSWIVHNLNTGSQVTRLPGDSNLVTPVPFGTYVDEHVGWSKRLFISGRANKENTPVLPPMTLFSLSEGEEYTATEDTKLFLGAGILVANTTTISEPGSVIITSGKTVRAEADSYGVIFDI
jgi:hypothetical protein